MINAFVNGASYPFKGLCWLPRPGLRGFVLLPLLVNTLLFGAVIVWGAGEFGGFIDWLLGFLPSWLDWLRWLLWPFFVLTALLVSFYTFTLAANMIASPFNSLLAGRVAEIACPGSTTCSSGKPPWKELVLAPLLELKKLIYFLLWALPLLALFIIPGINAAAPFGWAAFSAWMLALQYMDYPMGNHGLPFRAQRRLLSEQRPLVMGFGAAILLLTLIPVVNFLIMPAAVIGATLMWLERFAQPQAAARPLAGPAAGAPPPRPDVPAN